MPPTVRGTQDTPGRTEQKYNMCWSWQSLGLVVVVRSTHQTCTTVSSVTTVSPVTLSLVSPVTTVSSVTNVSKFEVCSVEAEEVGLCSLNLLYSISFYKDFWRMLFGFSTLGPGLGLCLWTEKGKMRKLDGKIGGRTETSAQKKTLLLNLHQKMPNF